MVAVAKKVRARKNYGIVTKDGDRLPDRPVGKGSKAAIPESGKPKLTWRVERGAALTTRNLVEFSPNQVIFTGTTRTGTP